MCHTLEWTYTCGCIEGLVQYCESVANSTDGIYEKATRSKKCKNRVLIADTANKRCADDKRDGKTCTERKEHEIRKQDGFDYWCPATVKVTVGPPTSEKKTKSGTKKG